MKRRLPGWYEDEGEGVGAERVDSSWRFYMRGREIAPATGWLEPHAGGAWCRIGSWKTLAEGRAAFAQLKAGTHFYDETRHRTRLYDDEVYVTIRERTA